MYKHHMVVLHLVYHQIQLVYTMMMHIIGFIFIEFACKCCTLITYCMYLIVLRLKDDEMSSMDVNDISLERNIFMIPCNINSVPCNVSFIFENTNTLIDSDLNITALDVCLFGNNETANAKSIKYELTKTNEKNILCSNVSKSKISVECDFKCIYLLHVLTVFSHLLAMVLTYLFLFLFFGVLQLNPCTYVPFRIINN